MAVIIAILSLYLSQKEDPPQTRVINYYFENPQLIWDSEEFQLPPNMKLQEKAPGVGGSKAAPGPAKNKPCPCGSGKKYKSCHGKSR